jgi:hypothetical protein
VVKQTRVFANQSEHCQRSNRYSSVLAQALARRIKIYTSECQITSEITYLTKASPKQSCKSAHKQIETDVNISHDELTPNPSLKPASGNGLVFLYLEKESNHQYQRGKGVTTISCSIDVPETDCKLQ